MNPSSLCLEKQDYPLHYAKTFQLTSALVVDDDKICQYVVKKFLHQLGFSVTLAENGKQALALVQQSPSPFVFIIMDVNMPHMDGIEATRLICQQNTKKELPLIFGLTTQTDDSTVERCLKAGMQEVMSKPLSLLQLKTTLQRQRYNKICDFSIHA